VDAHGRSGSSAQLSVFDAQAIVALLVGEPAAAPVAAMLRDPQDRSVASAVNVSEVVDVLVRLRRRTFVEVAEKLDWLAAGIRPTETIVFVQSRVPQVTELHTILSMFTPLGKLTDLPTFKEQVAQQPHNVNYGLVGYPVLMSADIALYKADTVPVGIDQASHIEFTREVVRTFNFRTKKQVLIEPQMKNTEYLKVLGTDGVQKMGKSLNNHIELAATPEETQAKVMTMVTDPQRQRRTDPGRPEVCNVFTLHNTFSPAETPMIDTECRRAGIGCVDCKKILAKNINAHLEPFRAKRAELVSQESYVQDVLHDGGQRARAIAQKTMIEVREAMQLP